MGKLYLGSEVDINLFKKELAIFNYKAIQLWVDLGFLGIGKTLLNTIEAEKKIVIAHKKKPKQLLTDAQKLENFEIAKVRIKVEHAIGGMKRYYILRHENRFNKPHQNALFNTALECCTGLWNFRRAFKNKPY